LSRQPGQLIQDRFRHDAEDNAFVRELNRLALNGSINDPE